jgi:hypothetical protein
VSPPAGSLPILCRLFWAVIRQEMTYVRALPGGCTAREALAPIHEDAGAGPYSRVTLRR